MKKLSYFIIILLSSLSLFLGSAYAANKLFNSKIFTDTLPDQNAAESTNNIDDLEEINKPIVIPILDNKPEPPHVHSFTLTSYIAPKCKTPGQQVLICECKKQRMIEIKPLQHDYILSEQAVATYMHDGRQKFECTRCHDIRENIIPRLTGAIDTDMCGDSLLWKILPHTEMQDEVAAFFELRKAFFKSNDEKWYFVVDSNETYDNIINTLKNNYYYYYKHLLYSRHIQEDGTVAIEIMHNNSAESKFPYIMQRLDEIMEELMIDNTITQKEAIFRINNWICDNKYYDYDSANSIWANDSGLYHSIMDENGICSNYAAAFHLLCLRAGIECYYYSSRNMAHAWNVVVFSDGTELWVDATWNDSEKVTLDNGYTEKDVNAYRSKYLLITYDEMAIDHIF